MSKTSDSPREPHRIAGYAVSLAAFSTLWGGGSWLISGSRRTWPNRYAAADLVVGALATHKLTRIIAKEGVTTPLRAPFTEFDGEAGSAEVHESPRHGAVHSLGELISCPFCLAPWVATAYVAGLVLAPGPTRAFGAAFATVAGSDALQHAYAAVSSG
ncbi:DUF1360 domain-containing protein [Nocardioides sp. SR21]|uniref:DUF1360 domain-containing protein n=1 Tax=Nocardioides sp. SR21 TaxID=2919501 RepID=UPI001FA98C6E|nr:DUF1360 domain-containing protein [Nocardioides sp. SR21]